MKREGLGKNAVVLLSGGLDSAVVLSIAKAQGYEPYALTIDYGQNHGTEIPAARRIAAGENVAEHLEFNVDLRRIGGSALTSAIDVPKGRSSEEMTAGIPITYVPARNTVFLSLAVAWAEVLNADDIFFGANQIDHAGYPDCRLEYVQAYEAMANLATKRAVEGSKLTIHTPLIESPKAGIIRRGLELGTDFARTSSCYAPLRFGVACRDCDACLLRLSGFAEAGVTDPIPYRWPK